MKASHAGLSVAGALLLGPALLLANEPITVSVDLAGPGQAISAISSASSTKTWTTRPTAASTPS